ncbi:hypothetical protein SEA_JUICYJAY_55 [Mycobacterium phage JuicyJay]|nr:hypothetical protein SEA_JUICYJAY_55 [Mycobacterium phage JuicyJay]
MTQGGPGAGGLKWPEEELHGSLVNILQVIERHCLREYLAGLRAELAEAAGEYVAWLVYPELGPPEYGPKLA